MLVLSLKQSHVSELADDENDAGSTDEHWDLEELHHRLVLTQRKLIAQDRDENKIPTVTSARLDADVDDLLRLFSKRPRGSSKICLLVDNF